MKKEKLALLLNTPEGKEKLLEALEDNDYLMLEVLETILRISDRDLMFREKVLDKIFETEYLSRNVEDATNSETKSIGCCQNIADR